MNQNDAVTFNISQVAKIVGVTSATIRNWEKNGLLEIKRSPSNYRVFTVDDIETLKKLKEYSVEKHMGSEAIKLLMPASSGSELQTMVEQQKEVLYSKKMLSEKWREIRKQQGYTLEEVSQAVGISVAHLSNLENGGNVSLNLMNKLAYFYHENPLYFFQSALPENHLVRADEGEPFQLKSDPGIEMTSLIAMRDHTMYPVMCTCQPGCGNPTQHAHNGEEMIYLFSGVLEVLINDEPPYIIHPGDTFYYRGSDLHSWKNISSKPAKLLWVHCMISR